MLFAIVLRFFIPNEKKIIPINSVDATSISDKNAMVPNLDRENFSTIPEQIYALQRSIPNTSNIKAFNGTCLSIDEMDELKEAIASFKDDSYDVSFVIVNVDSGKGIAYNTDELFYSASAIKAPYIASLLSKGELNEDRKTDDILNQEIESILLWSDNDAYLDLDEHYDSYAFQPWGAQAGLDHSLDINYCYLDLTSADLAKMWLQIYSDYKSGLIDSDISELATKPEVSSIHSIIGNDGTTWSKAGWIPDGDRFSATNDAGIIKTKESTYVMAICSNAPSNFELVDNMVAALSKLETNLT